MEDAKLKLQKYFCHQNREITGYKKFIFLNWPVPKTEFCESTKGWMKPANNESWEDFIKSGNFGWYKCNACEKIDKFFEDIDGLMKK